MTEENSITKLGASADSILNEEYDVVIVGSGPAGASTAKSLADKGLDVVIIEKCSFKRDKMCSGMILPSAREFLDKNYPELPDHMFMEPRLIKGSVCIYTDERDCPVVTCPGLDLGETVHNPEPGFNVDRSDFDYWLCEQSGAQLVGDCLFLDCKDNDTSISVHVKYKGKHRKIKTRFLVGADGPISRVRRSIAPEVDKNLNWIALYEEHYEGHIDLDPEWMYWILDATGSASLLHKNGLLHITAGATPVATAKQNLNMYLEFLRKRHGLSITKTFLCRGIVMNDLPYRENYFIGSDRILLAGEAAGFVRALDGITSALVTGMAAGESILESIGSDSPPLKHYAEHSLVSSEWQNCKKLQSRLGPLGFVMG